MLGAIFGIYMKILKKLIGMHFIEEKNIYFIILLLLAQDVMCERKTLKILVLVSGQPDYNDSATAHSRIEFCVIYLKYKTTSAKQITSC